jgi:hypothetical protein
VQHARSAAVIDYTNWRGERRTRTVLPTHFWYGKTEYHPVEGQLMTAVDLDSGEMRTFALSGIHSWVDRPLPPGGHVAAPKST